MSRLSILFLHREWNFSFFKNLPILQISYQVLLFQVWCRVFLVLILMLRVYISKVSSRCQALSLVLKEIDNFLKNILILNETLMNWLNWLVVLFLLSSDFFFNILLTTSKVFEKSLHTWNSFLCKYSQWFVPPASSLPFILSNIDHLHFEVQIPKDNKF